MSTIYKELLTTCEKNTLVRNMQKSPVTTENFTDVKCGHEKKSNLPVMYNLKDWYGMLPDTFGIHLMSFRTADKDVEKTVINC